MRVRQSRTRAANGVGDRLDGLGLPHDPGADDLLHAQQLFALAFEHARHGDSGPFGDDLRDLRFGHLIAQQLRRLLLDFESLAEAPLQIWDASILQFGHARQILRAPRGIEIEPRALERLFDRCRALYRGLLRLPDLLEIGVFLLERPQSVLERAQALARRLVGFFFERLALDFQLDDAPI